MNSPKKKAIRASPPKPASQKIHLIRYREADVEEVEIKTLQELPSNEGWIHWLNIVAPERELLFELAARFELHPLTRDYFETAGRRPALYEFDNHLLVTARTLTLEKNTIQSELIGLVIGAGFVITLQENDEDAFDTVRNRIRSKLGWIRSRGSDHLFYRLLDAITEEYFLVSEHLEDQEEALMNMLESGEASDTQSRMRLLRHSAVEFRRAVAPLRDVLAALLKSESLLLSRPVDVFLRDVHQQSLQLVEVALSLMDQIKEIQQRHYLIVSEGMNSTMKVLTVVTSFFIPLTFLVGVYGMNFEFMPELSWKYGYMSFWAITVIICLFMYITFKKKGWF